MENLEQYRSQDATDVKLAEEMLNQNLKVYSSKSEELKDKEKQVQEWYEKEFLPYKKAREKQKEDFQEFKRIVNNHTQEVKFMLSSILEDNLQEAVTTWNFLKLEPEITEIKLEGDYLILKDIEDDEHEIHFDTLLDQIEFVLGG